MYQFIREGYLTVQADFPVPLNQDIYQRIEAVFEKEKNPGNNILPRVPQIQRVYDHPAVQGALISILGPDYLMNPHRHCHLNPPGSKGQNWHKDNYVFDEILRQPRPRWVFAFYYPQEVTPDMGADTLGNMGPAAQGVVPGLARLLADEHPRVRRHAAEALGRVGAAAAPALPALIDHIRDPDLRVRHNACLALAKIGQPAEAAIPLLFETLEDEDRYVRYFAEVALRRLATPASQRVLLDTLFTARWCPVTNPENMY
jgi:hypothetical protein